MSQTVHKFI